MREVDVEQPVCEFAEAQGYLVRKIQYVGRRGAPDRLFVGRGKILVVEFKRRGKRPDVHQEREHDRFRGRGVPVHVIDNIEDGKALFA
jgi:hypothetical protein